MGFHAHAQINDFKSWNTLSIEKTFSKKTSLILQQEVRFDNNATHFNDYLTVLGGQYAFNKHLKVRGFYRYTLTNDIEDGQEKEHRLYTDVVFGYNIKRIILNYRTRYQVKFVQTEINRWHHIRNRFTVKYDIPKSSLLPYIQYEFYYSLNHPALNKIDRQRCALGIQFDINNDLSISSFYRVQFKREYGKTPKNDYILGLGANLKL
jgi:hypothetical protein